MNKRVMKKLKFLTAIIALIASATFTSCQVEQLDEELLEIEEEVAGPALFMVDFDGQTYVATTAQAQVQGNAVSILGLRGTAGESISLTIPGGTATGIYTNAVMMYVPSLTSTAFYTNTNPNSTTTNGAVNITSINTTTKTISGTFSFTGHYTDASQTLPAKSFTSGIFENIPYTGTMPGTNPGPGPGENPVEEEYFKAKVGDSMVDFGTIMTMTQSGMLSISGSEGSNNIQLMMSGNITTGTYSLGMGIPTAIVTTGSTNAFNATSGTLSIISVSNGWIKGTFSFTGSSLMNPGSTLAVTEGEFNVEL